MKSLLHISALTCLIGVFTTTITTAQEAAERRAIEEEMKAQSITKTKMAEMMNTSRAVVNRLLNPDNSSLTLHTLEAASTALGKKLSISLV